VSDCGANVVRAMGDRGATISAAKKGKTTRSELGLTVPQAAERAGLDKRTFRRLVVDVGEKGVFHGTPIREGRGIGYRLDPVEFTEDLERAPRCEVPVWDKDAGAYGACGEVAGPSGRCGHHAAKGEPQVVLVCEYEPCGKAFTRYVSWLREHEGRGHYCSNECKGKAGYQERGDELHLPFTSEESKARNVDISNRIASDGQLDTAAAAKLKRYSVATVVVAARAGELRSELRELDGSLRRVYQPGDVEAWQPAWADQAQRRSNVAYGRHGKPAAGRLAPLVAEQRRKKILELSAQGLSKGDIAQALGLEPWRVQRALDRPDGEAVGRRRELSRDEKARVHELRAKRYSHQRIANAVGVSRQQVQRFLAS
jgi:predicted transcriptional regulator